MVSPQLATKVENPLTLKDNAKRLFQLIYGKQKQADGSNIDDNVPRIKVSSMVSRLSFLYEKIRNAVDYEEENLIRKNAIKRIIKRQLLIEGTLKTAKSQEVAVHLLVELIQAGYLQNNTVPEAKVYEVKDILDKYLELRRGFKEFLPNNDLSSKQKKERKLILEWTMGLAATEIENTLDDAEVKKAIVNDIFKDLLRVIKLPADLPYQNHLQIQVYLSIARTYLHLDPEMLSFAVFKYYTAWDQIKIGSEELGATAKNLLNLHAATLKQLDHPLKKQLDKISRKYAVYYALLYEVAAENPQGVYDKAVANQKAFFQLIKDKCAQKYLKVKSRLWRAGLRSIIYIFLTKSIFVILLEVPAIKFFGEQINPMALGINIAFPAFLLFLIILLAQTPDEKNTKKIIDGISEVLFIEKSNYNDILLKKYRQRHIVTSFFFNLIYLSAFLIALYFLIWVLTAIDFNWVSITIFLFFLCFVSFFSFRVKRGIKELKITEDRENIITVFFDFFYMPIVMAGKIMSDNVSKINVFVFVLDFIIEAPFKVLIEIVEEWTKYLKERKETLD